MGHGFKHTVIVQSREEGGCYKALPTQKGMLVTQHVMSQAKDARMASMGLGVAGPLNHCPDSPGS